MSMLVNPDVVTVTFAIGLPGRKARWFQGVSAPTSIDAPAGYIVLLYVPDEAVCLPEMKISDDGLSLEEYDPTGIQELRERYRRDAQKMRDAYVGAGCSTPLGRVQTDEKSRGLITGAIDLAEKAIDLGMADAETFVEIWTMEDNSAVAHTFDQLRAMGVAVGFHVSQCYSAARVIIASIEAADTLQELAAIDITSGYPT